MKENLDFIPCNIQSELQAVAIRIFFPIKMTICNVYIPPKRILSNDELHHLLKQLEPPFMLMGDFNAHNQLWGSNHIDIRGKYIETLVEDFNLVLLNSNSPKHLSFSYKTFSNIDLTFISPSLSYLFDWFVESDTY